MSPETSDSDPAVSARLERAYSRFDEANADDPNHELVGGEPQPKELVYARRMTAWLDRLAPDATEPLRLAARCQHIRRWSIPRSDYPAGRTGYRTWRSTLAAFHAQTAATILRDLEYDDRTIARVEALVRKERLKADPEVQTLEDVVCLVFLEYYLAAFATQHDETKLVDILRKTWRKMSDHGRHAALGLRLEPRLRALVERAAE